MCLFLAVCLQKANLSDSMTQGSSNAQSFTPSQFSQPSFTPAPPSGNYTQVPQPMTFTPLSQPPFSAVAQTPSFAPAQLPNMMLPGPAQPVTAPPAVQGFMPASPRTQPLSSSGIVPGSQVQSPQTTSSPSPAVALTPPPTVQTVDTSSVSGDYALLSSWIQCLLNLNDIRARITAIIFSDLLKPAVFFMWAYDHTYRPSQSVGELLVFLPSLRSAYLRHLWV